MTEYARREADKFILKGETVLEPDYPVVAGYAYVAVWEDGEVKVVTCWQSGRAIDLLADLNLQRKDKQCVEVRRCELVSRMLNRDAEE